MNLAARYFPNGQPQTLKIIRDAVIAFVVLVTLIVCWPFHTVPTGYRGVVTQFGAIKETQPEGLVVLPPWQKITNFSIRADSVDVKNAEGATSDTQPVHTSLTVRYAIDPNKVSEVFEKYSHSGDMDSFINTAALETFKAVTARYTAPDLIGKRAQVSMDVTGLLRSKVAQFGTNVISVDMTQFAFGKEYMAAITEKVTQEQQKLAADNKLLTVEAQQKQKVAVAEADARAVKAKADGDAYATITAAKADAEATKLNGEAKAKAMQVQAEALARNGNLVELTKAEKWDGKLPQNMYAGAPIPFMPMK